MYSCELSRYEQYRHLSETGPSLRPLLMEGPQVPRPPPGHVPWKDLFSLIVLVFRIVFHVFSMVFDRISSHELGLYETKVYSFELS